MRESARVSEGERLACFTAAFWLSSAPPSAAFFRASRFHRAFSAAVRPSGISISPSACLPVRLTVPLSLSLSLSPYLCICVCLSHPVRRSIPSPLYRAEKGPLYRTERPPTLRCTGRKGSPALRCAGRARAATDRRTTQGGQRVGAYAPPRPHECAVGAEALAGSLSI